VTQVKHASPAVLALVGKIPTYNFGFGNVEYLDFDEIDEQAFYQNGYDQGLSVNPNRTPQSKECAHQPGATLIRGRVICKICGINLN
jgi:hypothetical protein